jgi:hypothetical protein
MPFARRPWFGGWAARAAAALLLVSGMGCNVGDDRLACTLDPAALVLTQAPLTPPGCAVSLAGRAFSDHAECGVACPRPWTVKVRWSNRTTGAGGAQAVAWVPGGSCWPFFSSSCGLSAFSLDVPLAAGANDLLIEADEGDGFTACQPLQVTGPPGCHQ